MLKKVTRADLRVGEIYTYMGNIVFKFEGPHQFNNKETMDYIYISLGTPETHLSRCTWDLSDDSMTEPEPEHKQMLQKLLREKGGIKTYEIC